MGGRLLVDKRLLTTAVAVRFVVPEVGLEPTRHEGTAF